MDSTRGISAHNVHSSRLANATQAARATTDPHSPERGISLTKAMLSNHAQDSLDAQELADGKQGKNPARRANEAITIGQLQLSPNQSPSDIARFVAHIDQDVLTIEAKLNENSKYEVLSVTLQSGAESPVVVTLPKPSVAVTGAVSKPPASLRLPDELLIEMVRGTGKNGEGVNLSLRETDERMKGIAEDQMSPKQRFVIENGQTLKASGHSASDMRFLASQPKVLQAFVVNHGETLKASGYSPLDIQSLFELSQHLQAFVIAHGETLKASGHSPWEMRSLFGLNKENVQKFVVDHGETLKTSGHSPLDMQFLASRPEDVQKFVVDHGDTLQASGHSPSDMQFLASRPEEVQAFILAHGESLKASGHSLSDIQSLADRPKGRRDFVVAHCKALHALGHSPWNMQYLAGRSKAQQKSVLG